MFNERLEIEGDKREEIRAELERIEGYEQGPQPEIPSEQEIEDHYHDWLVRFSCRFNRGAH